MTAAGAGGRARGALARPLAAAALAAAAAALPAGCQQNGDAAGAVACTDFQLGTDLTAVTWGSPGQAEVDFALYVQACADLAQAAAATVASVAGACEQIASDLGGDPASIAGSNPVERMRGFCDLAAALVGDKLGGKLTGARFQPASCSFFVERQACCEAACLGEPSCTGRTLCDVQLGSLGSRCVPVEVSGSCLGDCTGTCEGSADLAVACYGACAGACEGSCSTACAAPEGADCEGLCTGVCDGTCRGACQRRAGKTVACAGDCTGGCTARLASPRCKGELLPPSAACQGSPECLAACKASAAAAAPCADGALVVEAAPKTSPQALASLVLHGPALLQAAGGRGALLAANAAALAQASTTAATAASALSIHASVCVTPASAALATAATNLSAAVTSAGKVTGAIGPSI